MLMSYLLAVPYCLAGIAIMFFVWAAGGLGYALLNPRRFIAQPSWFSYRMGSGLFLLGVRIACGLVTISWVTSVLGVAGLFRKEIVLPGLLAIVIAGLGAGWRWATPLGPLLHQDRIKLAEIWGGALRPEKVLGGAVVLWVSAIFVNAIIGSLVPDFNQDPLWYHLSVPQQWIFEQRFVALPDVMPSAYPLAVEAIYAVLLLLNPANSVLCSLLVSCSGIAWFTTALGATALALNDTRDARGWGIVGAVGGWGTLLVVYGLIAPVQPKNDIVVMLISFAGAGLIWVPMLAARRVPDARWWAVGAALLGTACAAKPPFMAIAGSMLVCGLVAALGVLWQARQSTADFSRAACRQILLVAGCAVIIVVALAPWMVRGWLSHGLPLFPLGIKRLPVNPEFRLLTETFLRFHTVVNPLEQNWMQIPGRYVARIMKAGANGEKCIFIYTVVSLSGLVVTCGAWRVFALWLSSLMLLIVLMQGTDEIFRMILPAYAISTLLVARLTASTIPRLTMPIRVLAGGLLLLVIVASLIRHQHRIATFKTHNWKYRPVLSQADVLRYAQHAEKGFTLPAFDAIGEYVGADERVLLLDFHFPFYLHRDTLWSDDALIKGGLAERWRAMDATRARRYLHEQGIDAVLQMTWVNKSETGPVRDLEQIGVLRPVKLPDALPDWELWKVEHDLKPSLPAVRAEVTH